PSRRNTGGSTPTRPSAATARCSSTAATARACSSRGSATSSAFSPATRRACCGRPPRSSSPTRAWGATSPEASPTIRRPVMIETLLQDTRHALRVFRRNAGPTLVGVLALGLGIGANTAMFSVVHAVVLRPLPYPDPDRIVRVWEDSPTPGADEYFLSMGLVRDLRAARSLEHLSEYWLTEMNFADG